MTQIKLVANAKNNVDLHIIPIKDEVEITEEYILDFISESEHCNLLVNKTNINNALAELNDVLKSLKENQTGHEIIYHILDRVDASISIIIDDDEMSAKAIINTAHGGKHLSANHKTQNHYKIGDTVEYTVKGSNDTFSWGTVSKPKENNYNEKTYRSG